MDKQNKIIISKLMEGSSEIFCKNYFNLLSMTILFDRDLYEKIIRDSFDIKYLKIKLPEYYYQNDYPFPNLNSCIYICGNKREKMNRIKKMYFNTDGPIDKYWFKIII